MVSIDNQFSNCSNVDLMKINFIFCGTGAICCLISAVILGLIFIHKAYYSVLERLFLYLMIAIFMRELFMAASFEHHFKYDEKIQQAVCSAIGFIWNWTGILVFVFTVGMKIYLLLYVNHITRGDTDPVIMNSRRGKMILECLYVVYTVLATLIYSSIPFYTNNFGLAGPWCWIRALDENCTVSTSGVIHQMLNGYIFYVSGSVIGLILLIATAVLYCRIPSTRNNEARKLLKKSFCVIITFLVNIVMMVFALLVRVFAAKNKKYDYSGLWYSFGVTFPVSLLLFPVVYMICFFRMKMCSYCRSLQRRRRCRHHSIQNKTIQESNRVSASSSTEGYKPTPTGIASVCVTEPLVNTTAQTDGAVGYGSVANTNRNHREFCTNSSRL